MNKNGNLSLVKSTIYLEEDYINDAEQEDFKFLNIKPKNKSEEQLLTNYINIVERKYDSKFVEGKEKALLMQDIRQKLKQEILSETKDWKEVYGRNAKM